jgi:hypothetical protein
VEKVLSTDEIARLAERAGLRRDDGSRGWRARRAWRRLVKACAAGDAAAQEAVRAAELTDTDVLELLAAAPAEPADRAAYLVLIGQGAQHRALDPDGSLLALAYRAAAPEARERLRTLLAAEGDTEVIRVVVTGERRDRLTEMSYDELDYLCHHLAERRSWDELRRLVRDLPLAKAAAAARLLPPHERTGNLVSLLTTLAGQPPEHLRATVGRLPSQRVIMCELPWYVCEADFSPDASELTVMSEVHHKGRDTARMFTLRISTGETQDRFTSAPLPDQYPELRVHSVLHLGDEILLRWGMAKDCRIVRVLPDDHLLGRGPYFSSMRRSSSGAVMFRPEGMILADRGADRLRYVPVSRPGEQVSGSNRLMTLSYGFALATLPSAGRVAFIDSRSLSDGGICVADERGRILHTIKRDLGWHNYPTLSFLSPTALALHYYWSHVDIRGDGTSRQHTEIWEFPPDVDPHRAGEHQGAIRQRWPLEQWLESPLDESFAHRLLTSNTDYSTPGWLDEDLPWLQSPARPSPKRAGRQFQALAPSRDMLALSTVSDHGWHLEVHSPHLPSARELLRQPLLHSAPEDLRRIRDLRTKIGDPAVRDALDLLATCLGERFGGDIALGSGPVAAGGTTDIALGENGEG